MFPGSFNPGLRESSVDWCDERCGPHHSGAKWVRFELNDENRDLRRFVTKELYHKTRVMSTNFEVGVV